MVSAKISLLVHREWHGMVLPVLLFLARQAPIGMELHAPLLNAPVLQVLTGREYLVLPSLINALQAQLGTETIVSLIPLNARLAPTGMGHLVKPSNASVPPE
jgi:hypothetical protein